jgi:hypothetical protein
MNSVDWKYLEKVKSVLVEKNRGFLIEQHENLRSFRDWSVQDHNLKSDVEFLMAAFARGLHTHLAACGKELPSCDLGLVNTLLGYSNNEFKAWLERPA